MTSPDTNARPAAANAELERQRTRNLVPMLVVIFAVLSAVALFVLDRDSGSPAPQPNYRADAPPVPTPGPPQ
jgi:hypothetical protein